MNQQQPLQRPLNHEALEMMKKAHKTINRRTIDYNSVVMRYLEVWAKIYIPALKSYFKAYKCTSRIDQTYALADTGPLFNQIRIS